MPKYLLVIHGGSQPVQGEGTRYGGVERLDRRGRQGDDRRGTRPTNSPRRCAVSQVSATNGTSATSYRSTSRARTWTAPSRREVRCSQLKSNGWSRSRDHAADVSCCDGVAAALATALPVHLVLDKDGSTILDSISSAARRRLLTRPAVRIISRPTASPDRAQCRRRAPDRTTPQDHPSATSSRRPRSRSRCPCGSPHARSPGLEGSARRPR